MALPINRQVLEVARKAVKDLVRSRHKNDNGLPFEMTDNQADLYLMIFLKLWPRCLALTYTQWGKTDIVSMALVDRSSMFNEPWVIVAGKQSKAMLIMRKVIQHTFDHPDFVSKLEIDKDMPLDRLRRERSKESLSWLGGGGVRVLSANTTNQNQTQEALIGEGSPNIIEEEAPFIPDSSHAFVMRMMMGHKKSFLLKLGNAFGRNHFYRSSKSEKYVKIVVDYLEGIKEGRISQEQIEEVKDLPFFSELYECKFPSAEKFNIEGYAQLIPDELLEKAFISKEEALEKGLFSKPRKRMGGDIGGGGDRSAYVLRNKKLMWIKSTNVIQDVMKQVPIIEDIKEEESLESEDIALDYGGLGQGVSDRLWEKGIEVNKVMFGESPPKEKKDRFANMRAYMYYRLKRWLEKGGRIVKDDRFLELLSVNYKSDSERKFKIQPKEELKKIMKQLGIKAGSPDVGDASVLTFADQSKIVTEDDFSFM